MSASQLGWSRRGMESWIIREVQGGMRGNGAPATAHRSSRSCRSGAHPLIWWLLLLLPPLVLEGMGGGTCAPESVQGRPGQGKLGPGLCGALCRNETMAFHTAPLGMWYNSGTEVQVHGAVQGSQWLNLVWPMSVQSLLVHHVPVQNLPPSLHCAPMQPMGHSLPSHLEAGQP